LFVWEMAFGALRGVLSLKIFAQLPLYNMLTRLFTNLHESFRGIEMGTSVVKTQISRTSA